MKAKLPVASTLALALALASGCVEDDRGFVIVQNQIPEPGCIAPGGTSSLYRSSGTLDVSAVAKGYLYGYVMFPLVENNLTATAATDNQPERNSLQMRRFDVSLDMGELPVAQDDFSVGASGLIKPGATRSFGVEVLPAALVSKMAGGSFPPGWAPVVMVTIRAVADRSGGEVESGEFIYPVTICSECLVDWQDPCPDPEDTSVTVYKNECGRPQDDRLTCCPDQCYGEGD
jgi:hypothetical protein